MEFLKILSFLRLAFTKVTFFFSEPLTFLSKLPSFQFWSGMSVSDFPDFLFGFLSPVCLRQGILWQLFSWVGIWVSRTLETACGASNRLIHYGAELQRYTAHFPVYSSSLSQVCDLPLKSALGEKQGKAWGTRHRIGANLFINGLGHVTNSQTSSTSLPDNQPTDTGSKLKRISLKCSICNFVSSLSSHRHRWSNRRRSNLEEIEKSLGGGNLNAQIKEI